jgi:hypothetical protein
MVILVFVTGILQADRTKPQPQQKATTAVSQSTVRPREAGEDFDVASGQPMESACHRITLPRQNTT